MTPEFNELYESLKLLASMGCIGIKISFEDEGAQYNEMVSMRNLTSMLDLKLSVKIGGCEAKTDISNCGQIGSDIIIAPMVESGFALQKFKTSIIKSGYGGKIGMNVETKLALENYEKEMVPLLTGVDFVVFGRVDYITSLGKDRSYADHEEMYEKVSTMFQLTKKEYPEVETCLGGAISSNSKEFVKKLVAEGLLNKFETRYIIFDAKKVDLDNFEQLIFNATKFELQWLKFIHKRYADYAAKDHQRILMIQDRFEKSVSK